jgi:hypothetical protein
MINSNINQLSQIFNETTNSYKFLLFLSLIELIKESNFEKQEFQSKQISARILATAWYPSQYYKLSLGKQDKLKSFLIDLNLNPERKLKTCLEIAEEIEKKITYDLQKKILRFSPYRLIRPFLNKELGNKTPDHRVNKRITTVTGESNNNALYKINQKNDKSTGEFLSIKFDVEWIEYIKINYTFLRTWTLYSWATFIQKNNPNSLAILDKISPILKRPSLSLQRRFWKKIVALESIKCPYSGQDLSSTDFDLDHFLPRSYIAHDQFWNLVPSSAKYNRSKNDRIPNSKFIGAFVEIQNLVIEKYLCELPNSKNEISNYLTVLGIESEVLLKNKYVFKAKLESIINTHLEIAKNIGFSEVWDL